MIREFRSAAIEAALASMRVMQPYQCGLRTIDNSEIKEADQTLVTVVDRESEAAATGVLRRHLGDLPILREEGGWTRIDPNARFMAELDPVDGTLLLGIGAPGSVVILVLYDRKVNRVVCAVTGDPLTGKIRVADDVGCELLAFGPRLGDSPLLTRPCQVWNGKIDPSKGVFLIDLLRPFSAHGGTKDVWSREGLNRLFEALQGRIGINSLASNGLHQSLVADGMQQRNSPKGIVGSLTAAMGGSFDCAAALHVIRAGGAAVGLHVNPDRTLRRCDPLDTHSYDMLLTANSPESLDWLHRMIMNSFV